jgi:hypothetical protein
MGRSLGSILARTGHVLNVGKESIRHNAAVKMTLLHLLYMVEPYPFQDMFLLLGVSIISYRFSLVLTYSLFKVSQKKK